MASAQNQTSSTASSPGGRPRREVAALRSVFARSAMLFGLCAVLIIGVMATLDARSTRLTADTALLERVDLLADMVATESGGGIQFNRPEALQALLQAVQDDNAGRLRSLLIYNAQGKLMANTGAPADPALDTLAAEALQSGQLATLAARAAVAAPAIYGRDAAVVGAVVVEGDIAAMRATIFWYQLRAYLIGVGLFALTVLGMSLPFRRMVSRPLLEVNNAMQAVGNGSYEYDIPGLSRPDEIGQIARSLDSFRFELAIAESARMEARLKGTAFEGSSAALMMCDSNMQILYLNAATTALMRNHAADMRQRVPGFDPETLIGRNMDDFHAGDMTARRILSDLSRLPHQAVLRFGRASINLTISAVHDEKGNHIGFVVEWKDITAEMRNAAVLSAIDSTQVRAEFSPEGAIEDCNGLFGKLIGRGEAQLFGQPFRDRMAAEGLPNGEALLKSLNAGETVTGRITLRRDDGSEAVVNGCFAVTRERSGKVRSLVLLGTDVTEIEARRLRTEAERAAMLEAQAHVVEALRLGLEQLAGGDLTAKLDQPFSEDYERLRTYFNAALEQMRGAIQGVIDNAGAIRSEANEISSAADDLSRRTEQQAATLEQTAAALDELTSSVRSAAEVAGQANRMVTEAKVNAETSGNVVREAVVAMGEIEESSDKISRITGVIDEIAFQTNLLALNAGVEAARAGEAGRGFAVVASEVRALAQRSSEAAREIAGLISASSHQVKRGVDLVGQAGQALSGIESSIAEIYSCVSDIAVSAKEQSAGLAEINTAVNQLDQVTQQNAAMFEETTAASHSLNREAETLTQTMGRFRTGDSAPAVTAPAARPSDPRPAARAGTGSAIARTPARAAATPRAETRAEVAATPPSRAAAGGRRLTALAVKPSPQEDNWEDF